MRSQKIYSFKNRKRVKAAQATQEIHKRAKKFPVPFTVIGTLLAVGWPLSGLAVQAALLVSLGMPDAALKAYLIQSRQAAIPLVIRGLYGASPSANAIGQTEKNTVASSQIENFSKKNTINPEPSPLGSFRATAERLQQLLVHPAQGGVVIDPVLFRAFAVHAVPALVIYDAPLSCLKHANRITDENPPCDESHFDVAMGNLPLEKLLARIAQRSRSPERAAYAQQLQSIKGAP